MQQRYASIQSQLRFSRGDYSYVVHSMGASVIADSNGISGLVVRRGGRTIMDRPCTRQTEFSGGFDAPQALPKDNDDQSIM